MSAPASKSKRKWAYDFERNYTSTFSDGVTTATVQSRLRTLHGLFGPKFQTGSGPFRVFVTGKVGFDNFTVTNASAPTGFTTAVGLANGATYFAVYPGGGIEAFAGPIGVRAEIGDDIFFNNGVTTTCASASVRNSGSDRGQRPESIPAAPTAAGFI